MRPSENNLYVVHYRTNNIDDIEYSKHTLYATSSEEAKWVIESYNPKLVIMSIWQRVWSRGDE